jgi:hypothetical protein
MSTAVLYCAALHVVRAHRVIRHVVVFVVAFAVDVVLAVAFGVAVALGSRGVALGAQEMLRSNS